MYKSTEIVDLGRFLFQVSKQSSMNQFPDGQFWEFA
jgi:hypothetical protein